MLRSKWPLLALLALTVGMPSRADAARPLPEGHRTLSTYSVRGLSKSVLDQIAKKHTIGGRHHDQYEVYVHADEAQEFLKLAPAAKLIAYDNDAALHDSMSRAAYFDSYDEIQANFEQLAADHPDFVKMMNYDFMTDENGGPIVVLKISSKPDVDNPKKPEVVVTGCTHGDEPIATAVVLGTVEKLIEGYASDERIKKMIDWSQIYIVPVVSPTSYLISREVGGQDPNRVYPYPGNDQDPPLEHARSMMALYEELKPAGSLDFHGIGGMVMYPWGYTCSQLEDSAARQWYADVAQQMGSATGYSQIGDICNTIYQAPGGTVDAWHYLHDTKALVIEVDSSSKAPPESEIPQHVEGNAEATFVLIEALLPATDPNTDDDDDDTTSGEETSSEGDDDDDTTSESDGDDDDDGDTTSETSGDDDDDDGDGDDDDDTTSQTSGDDDDDNDTSSDSGDDDDDDATESGGDDDDDDDDGSSEDEGKSGCAVAQHGASESALIFGGLAVLAGMRRRRRSMPSQ